jgi:DNA-directed RNA polymerase specialized sigma24 family protein
VSEVAEALDITSQQVWDRQHRAMQKFAALFNLVAGPKFDETVEL